MRTIAELQREIDTLTKQLRLRYPGALWHVTAQTLLTDFHGGAR